MTDKPDAPLIVENIPSISEGISAIASAGAPFIYFEHTPFFGLLNGVGKITLEARRQIANGPNGGVLLDRVLVAHLVGNIPAMRNLRAAVEGILLMAEPKPEGPPH